MTTSAARSGEGGACRLTQYNYYDAIHDYSQIDYFSYKNRLVDEWTTFYGWVYKMEYDGNRKMKIARAYAGGELAYTIQFVYKNNKVVKEIWYNGNTQEIADEVTNTYNVKGQLIKNQSLNGDYYVINTYTPQGYLESWHFFVGGVPVQKNIYTYNDNFKNPYESARPGIEYSFAWSNSAFGAGNRWYSSEKAFFYDENGDPFVYYDQDANQTHWISSEQNYPLRADYVDLLSGGSIVNSFEYENCGSAQTLNSAIKQQTRVSNPKKIISPIDRLFHGPSPEMIEKIKQLRMLKTTN